MAERRMFAKTIIDGDAFIDMPLSAQALYFHLSMRADDDGFVNNPKRIQRDIYASEDDMKLLIAKRFVIPFESGVVVIKHWRIHNYIAKDRYKETIYLEEKSQLSIKKSNEYELSSSCIQPVYKLDTQERIGKDRLDKDRIGEDSTDEEPLEAKASRSNIDYSSIIQLFNETCPSYPKVTALSDARRKAIKARLRSYTLDDFKTVFQIAESSPFLKGANDRNWSANFDWLIKDANFAKVLDGNYNHGGNAQQKPKLSKAAQDLEDAYDMIAKWAAKGDD